MEQEIKNAYSLQHKAIEQRRGGGLADPRPMSLKQEQSMTQFILRPIRKN